MLYKNSLKSMLFGALVLVCTNNVLATVTSKIEKLSEYDALEVLPEAMQGSIQTFKGKPIVVKLDDTDNGLFLNSTILTNNYTEIENHTFSLQDLTAPNTGYELSVQANDDFLFAMLINNDDKVRQKKNLLFKSEDGRNWQLFKSFPSEWELLDFNVADNNLSVSCLNCEDDLKISYVISSDHGKSWNKYSLPSSSQAWHFSSTVNNKLFVVTEDRNPEDRKKLISELLFTDLQNKAPKWQKADLSKVRTIVKDDAPLYFKDINEVYATSDGYLLANAVYSNVITDAVDDIEVNTNLISRDNGKTWSLFELTNLNNEELTQFKKFGSEYHLVTSNLIAAPNFDDAIEGPFDLLSLIMDYFKKQKYSYYTLTKEQLDNTEAFTLEPKFSFEHSLGFNIDYKQSHKASFVDAVLIRNIEDELKVEFYRLHN